MSEEALYDVRLYMIRSLRDKRRADKKKRAKGKFQGFDRRIGNKNGAPKRKNKTWKPKVKEHGAVKAVPEERDPPKVSKYGENRNKSKRGPKVKEKEGKRKKYRGGAKASYRAYNLGKECRDKEKDFLQGFVKANTLLWKCGRYYT